MVDYDGEDILYTYLNGLAWTALTKPTHYKASDRQASPYPNVIVIEQTGLDFEIPSTDKLRWVHTVEVRFETNTKANAFANLKYVVDNIFNYSNVVNKMEIMGGVPAYTNKRKDFILTVNVTELKSR